jgi:Domain of unknown function (DUF397)
MEGIDIRWRKSSYSGGNGGECIEVGAQSQAGRVLVRDTTDRQGPMLAFGHRAWEAFAAKVKADARS